MVPVEEDSEELPSIEILATNYVHHEDGTRSSQSHILHTTSDFPHNYRSTHDVDEGTWDGMEYEVEEYSREQLEEIPVKKKRKAVSDIYTEIVRTRVTIYQIRIDRLTTG